MVPILKWVVLAGLLAGLSAPAGPPAPGAAAVLAQAAADLRAIRSYSAAIEAYERLARLVPGDPAPLQSIGDIYLAQHRWLPAADAFNRALACRPDGGPAAAGLAAAYWGQGDARQAVTWWEKALQDDPQLAEARLRLAVADLQLERRPEAEVNLRAILQSSGTSQAAGSSSPEIVASAQLYLAMLLALDDPDQARRQLATPPEAPPAILANRDYLLTVLDRLGTAGSPAEAARLLGLAYVQLGQWSLACQALERALAFDGTDAEALAFLGHAEAQLGRPALLHLQAAVAARPAWSTGHYLLGLYYRQQQSYDLAAAELATGLEQEPGNAQAWLDLARVYVSSSRYADAEEALRKAVETAPHELAFQLALVGFYAEHSFQVIEGGLPAAENAARSAPDNPQLRDWLGWLYLLAGDAPRARLHLMSALQLDSGRAGTYYHLGVLYKISGQQEAAQLAFRRAVDLDGEGWYRERALVALRDR
jgi:tetratricopeptide (TPR) repeat protein